MADADVPSLLHLHSPAPLQTSLAPCVNTLSLCPPLPRVLTPYSELVDLGSWLNRHIRCVYSSTTRTSRRTCGALMPEEENVMADADVPSLLPCPVCYSELVNLGLVNLGGRLAARVAPRRCPRRRTPWPTPTYSPLLRVFFTLVAGPRRSLSLKLSDTRGYEPQIRARGQRCLRRRTPWPTPTYPPSTRAPCVKPQDSTHGWNK